MLEVKSGDDPLVNKNVVKLVYLCALNNFSDYFNKHFSNGVSCIFIIMWDKHLINLKSIFSLLHVQDQVLKTNAVTSSPFWATHPVIHLSMSVATLIWKQVICLSMHDLLVRSQTKNKKKQINLTWWNDLHRKYAWQSLVTWTESNEIWHFQDLWRII